MQYTLTIKKGYQYGARQIYINGRHPKSKQDLLDGFFNLEVCGLKKEDDNQKRMSMKMSHFCLEDFTFDCVHLRLTNIYNIFFFIF